MVARTCSRLNQSNHTRYCTVPNESCVWKEVVRIRAATSRRATRSPVWSATCRKSADRPEKTMRIVTPSWSAAEGARGVSRERRGKGTRQREARQGDEGEDEGEARRCLANAELARLPIG